VGGESSSTIARLADITIGGLTFKGPTCALAHDEGGALADPHIAGLVGGMILSRCNVYFDYDHKRMILEPNADFDKPFELDWSGLILKTGGRGHFHTITVVRALPGSPAEEAGIQTGDVITAADGVTADGLTKNVLWKKFQHAGETVRLTIERDGERRDVDLKLRRRV
jgi:C-terminal processing protease CtpA/Prc